MKDFEEYNWWTLRAPMILCADSLHDDGASVWARDDDAEGHFKKRLFGPLHPSKLSLWRVNPLKGLGHRDEPFRMERRVNYDQIFIAIMQHIRLCQVWGKMLTQLQDEFIIIKH